MKTILAILLIFSTAIAAQQRQSSAPDSENIPQSVRKTFTAKGLDKKYDLSFHLNPFYLRGDFNGDGKPDLALLVKQTGSGKVGIAVIHSTTNDVLFIGAGTETGNGGDNFDWMDYWYVYDKGVVGGGPGEKRAVRIKGEALFVGKSESASAVIYWNGTRYVWHQQGD
ncbi:MAG TPA: hypothetical protein VLD57_02305 [Blastocatellia bacterium]|nr:hypothetical protein [Blastocatellia bacterium]